ncbi:MAG TPA: PAS domain S-box protein [Pyrinomonadaceae bacterium]|nr:PAS domain S-box protein [Pyrinomonadaceae bacterium]
MKRFLVSEDLPESHDALKSEVVRLRRLNEQLVRELETRNGSDLKSSKNDSHGDRKVNPQSTDEAFRESEVRFRQVTDNISEVLWLQTHDYGALLYISPAYETVWGRTRESLYADPFSFLEAIHPDDRARVELCIKQNQETGFSIEYRIVKGDGEVRWIRDRAFPIKNEQGVVYRLAGIAEDITDRKAAEDAQRESAREILDLYNTAPCGYHSLDENGVYVQINDTELAWLGREREDVVGNLMFPDVLTPESASFFREKFALFLEEGSAHDLEYQMVCKDGSIKYILLSATSVRDEQGKFLMSRSTLYDITERKRAEELVRKSEEKFAKAFRSSPIGVSVTRMSDGMYVEANDTLATSFGYSREELFGKTTIDLGIWVDLKDRERLVHALEQNGSVRNLEFKFKTKQGNVVITEYSAEVIELGGEECVLAVLSDITERRHVEEALLTNEGLLRQFVKHTPAAIAMFDNEMRYLQVSDRFLKDYRLEGQDILGKVHYEIFPNIPERWRQVHQRILAGSIERCDEDPYIDLDGHPGWLQWESLPWRKAGGEIGGLILFTQVITERKRAEKALKASEERFAKIFNLSPYRMGIIRRSDGVILDVNDCWVRETGFSREETVNMPIVELDQLLDRKTRENISLNLMEGPALKSFEGSIRTKTGEERFTLSSAALVDFDGESCYLWAANDITDRKRVEEEKRHLIHDLNERVKELTALHQTARILQDDTKSVLGLLEDIVSFLPPAWQYAEVTAARICFGDLEVKSHNFRNTPWSQLVEFTAGGQKGEIEVVYLEERPAADIGPFLTEERSLIDSAAEMMSSALNRRYAQEALKESEEVFRTLAETVAAGIYIYRKSKFVYVNPVAESLTGYSRKELLGMTLLDLIHPEFRELVRERITSRQTGGTVHSHFEDKILTKSGEERWMDVTAASTMFRGEPAVIVTTFDITARKRAEEDLLQSEERYRTLFETAPNAVEVFDSSLKLMMTNERGAKLYGFEHAEELIGKNVFDFVSPEDRRRVEGLIAEMQKSGKPCLFECKGVRRDSTHFDLETRATVIPNSHGQNSSLLTVKTDITERKRAETALKLSEEQLRALSAKVQSTREEEGARIAREIHDELGAALTGLKWELEEIDSQLMTGNASSSFDDLRKRIATMTGLIEATISTVRRISSELRPGLLDDLGLVAAIEWQGQQFQTRTGIKFHFDSNLETIEISRDGATAVFRIFQEVLTNVLRHSHASNIYVRLLIRRRQLVLDVKDDGRGITEREKRNTRSLGLLGMKERALLVGGGVEIQGARGKGTQVLVRVPLN